MAPRESVPRMVHKRFAPLKPLLGRLPTDSKDSKTFRTDTKGRAGTEEKTGSNLPG